MPDFQLVSDYQPTGDQPQAIDALVEGLNQGLGHQVLLGATGTGKTFTIANVIAQVQRPTLILAHNKTLAAQLYSEFKSFFPHNAVAYFVSPKPTSPAPTPTLKRRPRLMKKSNECAWPPPRPWPPGAT